MSMLLVEREADEQLWSEDDGGATLDDGSGVGGDVGSGAGNSAGRGSGGSGGIDAATVNGIGASATSDSPRRRAFGERNAATTGAVASPADSTSAGVAHARNSKPPR